MMKVVKRKLQLIKKINTDGSEPKIKAEEKGCRK